MGSIAENLKRVREELAEACTRAGRKPEDVALMAVSKMHPAGAILEAYEAGQRLFGENRVQEAQSKLPATAGLAGLELHLIGPLQNNKTAKAAEVFHAVDSLDELKTARRLNDAAASLGKTIPVLIEVKLSPEDTKHGIAASGLTELLDGIASLEHILAAGLMTVPPLEGDPRPYFAELRRLRDLHAAAYPRLTQLSMGMSGDFQVAVEEGSTCVRVGTAIFGKRI